MHCSSQKEYAEALSSSVRSWIYRCEKNTLKWKGHEKLWRAGSGFRFLDWQRDEIQVSENVITIFNGKLNCFNLWWEYKLYSIETEGNGLNHLETTNVEADLFWEPEPLEERVHRSERSLGNTPQALEAAPYKVLTTRNKHILPTVTCVHGSEENTSQGLEAAPYKVLTIPNKHFSSTRAQMRLPSVSGTAKTAGECS